MKQTDEKEFFERGKQIAKWADNNMTKAEELKMRVEQDEQWAKMINRKWQGLSDGEIQEHLGDELVTLHGWSFVQGVRWANKKLKEKNNV